MPEHRMAGTITVDPMRPQTSTEPVAEPFALGGAASYRLDRLAAHADAELITGSPAAVDPDAQQITLNDGRRLLDVDRVVALPEVRGPAIPGTNHDNLGFIRIHGGWRMRGCDRVWAVGDAAAYPVKFGGLATQQADQAAAGIARLAGADVPKPRPRLTLRGALMTGENPRPLGPQPHVGRVAHRPIKLP